MCDSVNHTRFPEEDHLPDWARRDNKVTKGDRVEQILVHLMVNVIVFYKIHSTHCIKISDDKFRFGRHAYSNT